MGLTLTRDKLYKPFVFPVPIPSYNHKEVGWIDQIPIYETRHDNSKLTILFSHGNACDLGHIRSVVNTLSQRLQVNVISYDYPGYGLHQGTPTEAGCYETIYKVYKYLRANTDCPILVVGQSVGTGPSAWLAKEQVLGVCV